MTVVALVKDLLFKSKISETAAQLGKTVSFSEDSYTIQHATLVFVDLDTFGVEGLARVQENNPGVKIVGFCSHVNMALMQNAFSMGVQALPRSMFVKQLPSLLALYE